MIETIALVLGAVLMAALGGIYSGAETGIYRLSRLRLRLAVRKGKRTAALLAKAMHDSPSLVLSMLVGTNLANYLATGLVTYTFLSLMESQRGAELYATIVATPVLFVVSELIPKNLFLYRADTLSVMLSPFLYLSHKVFTYYGAVPLLKSVANVLARVTGTHTPTKGVIASSSRHQMRTLLEDTREEGLLSAVQADLVNRIMNIHATRLRVAMIPMSKVHTVDLRSDRAAILDKIRAAQFTRWPAVDRQPDNVVGFVNVYDVLAEQRHFDTLEDFVKPIPTMPVATGILEAINLMEAESQKIALVTRPGPAGRQIPMGIVTMKDLVEELVGELAEW